MVKHITALSVLTLALVVGNVASAQTLNTTSSTTTGTSATTNSTMTTTDASPPGLPNTGAGGNSSANTAMLLTSGALALGGIAYLARRRIA